MEGVREEMKKVSYPVPTQVSIEAQKMKRSSGAVEHPDWKWTRQQRSMTREPRTRSSILALRVTGPRTSL